VSVTGGDVRAVRLFSRHADIRTVAAYDDARQDLAGVVARKVVEASEAAERGNGDELLEHALARREAAGPVP
jgi:hypothetical protein